jgi:hypothetical protein
MTKQEILLNVFNKLRLTGAVRTKQDFAEKIGYNYTCTSGAFNGVERYLNDRFFTRIINAFPQVNEDYLRTGAGEILLETDPETGEVYAPSATGIVPLTPPRPSVSENMEKLMTLFEEQQALTRRQQEQTEKALEQIDQLITIIHALANAPADETLQ